MQLFSKGPITDALNQRSNRLANQIESISDNDIVNSNLEELIEYYRASFEIEAIELYKENISKSITEKK